MNVIETGVRLPSPPDFAPADAGRLRLARQRRSLSDVALVPTRQQLYTAATSKLSTPIHPTAKSDSPTSPSLAFGGRSLLLLANSYHASRLHHHFPFERRALLHWLLVQAERPAGRAQRRQKSLHCRICALVSSRDNKPSNKAKHLSLSVISRLAQAVHSFGGIFCSPSLYRGNSARVRYPRPHAYPEKSSWIPTALLSH
jgi:hypothetical protein